MAIALPPAASPLNINITFDVGIAPYVTKWYTDNRLAGENPSEFLRRMIGPSVIDYVASRSSIVARDVFQAEQASINAEVLVIKQSLGF